jgi:molybdopterin molybdotransferase
MKRTFSPAPSQQAFDWVDRWSISPILQDIPIAKAAGYCLAHEVKADDDFPVHAVCARDGFALRSEDTLGASDYNPLPLSLLNSKATLISGSAIQVSSGDALPDGANAVLPLEQAEIRHKFLDVSSSLAPGEGVIQSHEEYQQHDTLLPARRRLRPQDLARLALSGISTVKVVCRATVELIIAGSFEQDANGPMLTTLIARDDGDLIASKRTTSAQQLAQAILQSNADLIVITGSSGYGAHDYAFEALQDHAEIELDGVSIHPGGGVVLGKIADKAIVLLPGSPLACLCAYDLIVARMLRRLAAKPDLLPYRRQTFTLSRKLVSRIGQLEIARMRLVGNFTEPLAVADDRLLSSSIRADGFVLLPENSEGYAEGSQVEVYLYDNYN